MKKNKKQKTLICHLFINKNNIVHVYRDTQYTILQYLHYNMYSLVAFEFSGRTRTYMYDDNKSTTWLECV
jgi:hypothetical protein